MADKGFKRKLTAILCADAVEYSRLMGEDEDATIRTISEYRKIIANHVKEHEGRVVDSPGDNVLAEFSSAVDSVNCAVEIQRNLAKRNAELPHNRKMEFRIGVNLGDIAEEGDRIYGDGVNVAARIESLADSGAICISRTVYDQVKNKLELGYEYLGEHSVKNIAEPVRVYKILMEPEAVGKVLGEKRKIKRGMALAIAVILLIGAGGLIGWYLYIEQANRIEPASIEKMAYPLPDKPSIAVLPFDNMSGDPEDEYIADGITESIITALSKIDTMFVIARNSTFTYKGKPVKVKQVSEEFGVQYVLEGSIQRSADRIRVTAQLIDALAGHHLWADQYDQDMSMKGLFEILDEMTKKIVTEMDVELTWGEGARSSAKRTDNLEAWIRVSKGRTYLLNYSKRESNINAREQFKQAAKIDPNYADAWALLAFTHMIDVFFGWGENPSESFKKYFEYTHKAISLDDSSSIGHSLLGEIYRRQGQYEKAIAEGKKAIALEPNNDIWNYNLSRAMFFAGRPEDAIELIKKAIRLSPVSPANYFNVLGQSLHRAGRYEEALIAHAQALEGHKKMGNNPFWVHNGFTAAYLELGKIENARSHFKEALATNPNNNFIGWAKVWLAYKDEDLERLERLFEPLSNMAEREVKLKLYIHGEPPTFIFKYPEGIIDLQLTDSDEVLRKQVPGIGSFSVMVADIPTGMSIIDTGQNYFLPKLRKTGIGTNFTVVSNGSITLEDGTNACKTEIKWLYKDGISWMTTSVVSAYKKNKLVCLSTHTAGDSEKIAWIAESLTFQ